MALFDALFWDLTHFLRGVVQLFQCVTSLFLKCGATFSEICGVKNTPCSDPPLLKFQFFCRFHIIFCYFDKKIRGEEPGSFSKQERLRKKNPFEVEPNKKKYGFLLFIFQFSSKWNHFHTNTWARGKDRLESVRFGLRIEIQTWNLFCKKLNCSAKIFF